MEQYKILIENFLYLLLALYFVSGVLSAVKFKKTGFVMFFAGWCVNIALVVLNWKVSGQPPLGTMYHVMTAISLSFFPVFLLLKYRNKMNWLLPFFAFTSILPLMGPLMSMLMEKSGSMNPLEVWKRPPALQSDWFIPHVMSYTFSYALAGLAFILAIVLVIIYAWKKVVNHEKFNTFMDSNVYKKYSDAIYEIMLLSFPLMTFGMLSGAVWADEIWGGYWSWDSKETWSLITWTIYLIYLHCRKISKWKKWELPLQILAFLALLTTFLLVAFLPKLSSALHSYTSG